MPRFLCVCLAMAAIAPAFPQSLEPVDSISWHIRAGGIFPDYRGADAAAALGAGIVYQHREWPSFALELEVMGTVNDGTLGRFDFAASTAAAYLAWRSAGRMYLKLRGGALAEWVDVGTASDWGAGISGGAGLGWRAGDHRLELELTGIEEAAYAITLAWYF